MLSRSKLFAMALLVAVFGAGAAVGVAGSRAWGERSRERPESRPDRRDRSYVGLLEQELSLSPAQRDTVKRILAQYDHATREIWAAVRPRMDTVRWAVRAQIMTVLDSSQQERYRALTARSDSVRAERAREDRRGR